MLLAATVEKHSAPATVTNAEILFIRKISLLKGMIYEVDSPRRRTHAAMSQETANPASPTMISNQRFKPGLPPSPKSFGKLNAARVNVSLDGADVDNRITREVIRGSVVPSRRSAHCLMDLTSGMPS